MSMRGSMGRWQSPVRPSSCLFILSIFLLLLSLCGGEFQAQDDVNPDFLYRFFMDGTQTMLDYRHLDVGHFRVKVPRFMRLFGTSRILYELNFHLREGASERWSERLTLEVLFHTLTYGVDYDPDPDGRKDRPPKGLENAANWLNESVSVCEWEGITCGRLSPPAMGQNKIDYKLGRSYVYDWSRASSRGNYHYREPPNIAVTQIKLPDYGLEGTLPTQLPQLLHLQRLHLGNNFLKGSIPASFGEFLSLSTLDLGNNKLTGTIPKVMSKLSSTLEELWLEKNNLDGVFSYHLTKLKNCRFLDLSDNRLSGTIPSELENMKNLMGLFLEENMLTGTVMTRFGALPSLFFLNLSFNRLTGTLPTHLRKLTSIIMFHAENNRIRGTIPVGLFHVNLESLRLGSNQLSGKIPTGSDVSLSAIRWSSLRRLALLSLENNKFAGSLPTPFISGISKTIQTLELGQNEFVGTLPPEIGRMQRLQKFTVHNNQLSGTLPFEMGRLVSLKELNLTSNRFVGTVPRGLCEEKGSNFMVKQFGCDSILCPMGTFHPQGAATALGGCRRCPKHSNSDVHKFLGRTSCSGVGYVVGDADADGTVSTREVLRLFFLQTNGPSWGDQFQKWPDLDVDECDLAGVTCFGGGVGKIDLTDANIGHLSSYCGTGSGKELKKELCLGIPPEIGILTALEVLMISRKQNLAGTIPSEIGLLTRLKLLDLSGCRRLSGSIPTEIGMLSSLKVLNLSNCRFRGNIPSEIGSLHSLEKLTLSVNPLSGTLPSEFGNLPNIREVMISRLLLTGTIPTTIGQMTMVENIEIYGNSLNGTLPSEIAKCTSLKRLDAFNNQLSGSIPEVLSNIQTLQIIHLKTNKFTGTLPSSFGDLQYLTWFDATSNMISGTIPESYGSARSLKDLRLGGNRIFSPIPRSLCSNPRINGGKTRTYGCDAILCPLGQVDDTGFAHEHPGCKPCQDRGTTLYLGGISCQYMDVGEILSIFFDVMRGHRWAEEESAMWSKMEVPVCEWEGIACEEDGSIVTIAFPIEESEKYV